MGKRTRVAGSRMCLLALAITIASALTALGAASAPAAEYAKFAQYPTSNPTVLSCDIAVTGSGEFTVGTKNVPIKKPITLQGGLSEAAEVVVATASNDETLPKPAQIVPGGLIGIEKLVIDLTTGTTSPPKPNKPIRSLGKERMLHRIQITRQGANYETHHRLLERSSGGDG
jgi:hypothetical protein